MISQVVIPFSCTISMLHAPVSKEYALYRKSYLFHPDSLTQPGLLFSRIGHVAPSSSCVPNHALLQAAHSHQIVRIPSFAMVEVIGRLLAEAFTSDKKTSTRIRYQKLLAIRFLQSKHYRCLFYAPIQQRPETIIIKCISVSMCFTRRVFVEVYWTISYMR